MGTCSKDTSRLVAKRSCYTELSESAEQAKRRTEIARLRKLHPLWGHVESVVGLVTKSWTIASEARNSSRQILEQTELLEIGVDYYGF
ncbi:hypothetical protein F2Q69_00049345 [Brassica cretica]|uniref:Uncharacterized protein n=1 Tax=Brassica cretica TaxID=69181 RepID=A0A8S9Q147_BRACR|nr:hypothetical protein F2Q69_00049345 [Brassica cretica]